MNDKFENPTVQKGIKPNKIRRKLIHSAWVIPVVMSVNLPAHAQTSCCETPPGDTPLAPSCNIELNQSAVTLTNGGVQQNLSPIVEITITNTGLVPLSHPSSSLSAGLSYTSSIAGPLSSGTSINGGIPNPLMPGQSHTVFLTALGVNSCISGTLNVQFSRNGTNCSAPLSISCILPIP